MTIRHRGHKSHAEEAPLGAEWWRIEEERPAPMALGERIRHLRKEVGWSQAELGEKVGTDAGRISRYEGGRITPSIDALMRIAEVFNVSADHLLFDDVPRRPLHAAEDALGDRLAVIGELSADDLASLLNVVDGLVAKSRLRAMAGDLG
jgi:transcriptional regulator with XRE-family HTH domain